MSRFRSSVGKQNLQFSLNKKSYTFHIILLYCLDYISTPIKVQLVYFLVENHENIHLKLLTNFKNEDLIFPLKLILAAC